MKNQLILLAVALGLSAASAEARLNVVATLPDFGSIAEEIGGDKVKVMSLCKGTEDPHFVDAKPSFIRVLNQADVLVEGGAELEIGWLPPLVNNARNPKILADAPGHVILARGIRLLEVPTGPVDRSQGDVHAAGNPHYNLDPANGKPMAAALAETFSKLDPANAVYFQGNLEKFNARLEGKLAEWKMLMEPYRGMKVVTYHKSFNYLLERYGLVLAGTIEPKPGIEPSATHINALITQTKQAGVKLVILEPNRPRKTPQFVAAAIGARLVMLPGLVGGVPEAKGFIETADYKVRVFIDAAKQAGAVPQ